MTRRLCVEGLIRDGKVKLELPIISVENDPLLLYRGTNQRRESERTYRKRTNNFGAK